MRNPFARGLSSHALPLLGPQPPRPLALALELPALSAVSLLSPPATRPGLPASAFPPLHRLAWAGQALGPGDLAVPSLRPGLQGLQGLHLGPCPSHPLAVAFSPGLRQAPLLQALPKVTVATAWMALRPVLRHASPVGRVSAEAAERWLQRLAAAKRLNRRHLVLEALFEGVAVGEDTPLSYRAGERSLSYVLPPKALPPSVVVVGFDEKAGARVVGRFATS